MWSWLLKVESMGRSLSSYGPLLLLEKIITYARLFVLTWLLGTLEFGVWQLGVMVFNVAGAVAALGSSHGVARYVSYYEARGQLREFYRKSSWAVALLAIGMTALGLAATPLIAPLLAGGHGAGVSYNERVLLVILALVNGLLMALYQNMQNFIRAVRAIRLLGVMDLFYAMAFTVIGLSVAGQVGRGWAVLAGHAVSLALATAVGLYFSRRCLDLPPATGDGAPSPAIVQPALPVAVGGGPPPTLERTSAGQADERTPVFLRLLKFGFVSMLAALLWEMGNQVSVFFTNRYHGTEQAGILTAYRQLCQPVWVLSCVVWAVVFSHVASHWESNRRLDALRMTNLSYKATVLALMTLTIFILATAPWWSLALRYDFRRHIDLSLLGGLLMFFQCGANLGLAGIASKLQERPAVFMLISAAGVLANVLLAMLWVPDGGIYEAAWSAGLSMLLACGLAVAYALLSGLRMHPACHVLALTPALLLLPVPWLLSAWAVILLLSAVTPLVFTRPEKTLLVNYVRSLGGHRGRLEMD